MKRQSWAEKEAARLRELFEPDEDGFPLTSVRLALLAAEHRGEERGESRVWRKCKPFIEIVAGIDPITRENEDSALELLTIQAKRDKAKGP